MTKFKLLSGCALLLACSLIKVNSYAQMVGPDGYIQGTSVEFGISGAGGYEGVNQTVSPPPAGYHARTTAIPFGFIANPQVNAWLTFDGDFFTPGSPENGWGIEIGSTSPNYSNNCSGDLGIPGSLSLGANFDCLGADWEGDITSGSDLHIKINYLLHQTDVFYTTTISITNNTSSIIPELYYYRNVDPDNNEELGGPTEFTTTNLIESQPGSTPGCNLALVSAKGALPWPTYLGLAAVGNNWRATYGGFSNRDASNIWNGIGFTQTVGATVYADEAISLAYRIQNLAPGATETFSFVTIMDISQISLAIQNLIGISYPSSLGSSTACNPDTIRTCGAPVPISLTGSVASDYSWTWSPTAGLSTTTGPSVIANPLVTTTYTATGTPLPGACATFLPVTISFVVEVTPGGGVNPYITPVPPVCITDAPFNFAVDTAGGVWTGVGITSSTLGTFNPAIAGVGTYMITYTTTNSCYPLDTVMISVSGADPTITAVAPVCAGSASFNLVAASTGGTWSGTGITNPTTGTFNPATPGSFMVTYTIIGTCVSVDSQLVVVNPVTTPVTGISYTSPICISGPSPTLTTVAGFTTGGTYSSSPGGLSLNTTTGAVNMGSSSPGTYTITYSYPATTCGPAGSSTTTLVINPLIIPVLTFSYPTACATDTADAAPVTGTGFTTGGTYTSTSGLVIDDSTGVVDVNASTPGTYTITYAVVGSNALCTASGSGTATIVINPLPTILLGPEQTIWIGDAAQIYAMGGTSFAWSPAAYTSCPTCDTTIVTPPETTEFCVIVTELGCIDSACVKVNVETPCPSNRNMGVPNAFSPNNDGINDQFCLDGWGDCTSKFEVVIFDRWGEKVFESKDPNFCWDGIYNGKPLDPAVFVYFIKSTFETAGATPISVKGVVEANRTGNISLIR